METNRLFSFEKLNFWMELRTFIKDIYKITKQYPDEEKFGLTSQMRRSAISISSNLAEGTSRRTMKEQAHFTEYAFSSLMELMSQIIVSFDLEYINEEQYKTIRLAVESLSRQINGLRNSQLKRI